MTDVQLTPGKPMLKRFDEFGRDLSRGPAIGDTRSPTLRCGACRAVLSRRPERIAVGGAHRHRCVNPHGFCYQIGCFRRVENGRGSSASTRQDTWFAGYAWRVLVCGGCSAHIGWRFEAPHDQFFGLVLSRITED